MRVIPAVDIRGGMAVRLYKGDFERESQYGDPVDLALHLVERGAEVIHVVDLDGARTGDSRNKEVVLEIVSRVPVPVQVGGGIRSAIDVGDLIDGGVSSVVLGTTALESPGRVIEYVRRFPNRISLGLDYRRSENGSVVLSRRGWMVDEPVELKEFLAAFEDEPVGSLVVTAIERDGTLEGPDLDTLSEFLDLSALPVIAAGGVGSISDVVSLAKLRSKQHRRRLAGAITGKAVVTGNLDIRKAREACAASG